MASLCPPMPPFANRRHPGPFHILRSSSSTSVLPLLDQEAPVAADAHVVEPGEALRERGQLEPPGGAADRPGRHPPPGVPRLVAADAVGDDRLELVQRGVSTSVVLLALLQAPLLGNYRGICAALY